MKQADIIIEKGFIIPVTESDPATILTDTAVVVTDGVIQEIGDAEAISREYKAEKYIDASGMAVMPGFINTHFHFMQDFLKGSRDDFDLLDWIDKVSFPRIKVVIDEYRKGNHKLHYHSAMHAAVNLLKSGITCTTNMEWAMGPEIVDAYERAGIRAINILTLTDVKTWTPPEAVLEHDEYFELGNSLLERCRSSKEDRVDFAYGIACPNSCTPELIKKARAESYKNNTNLHIHLAETKYEFDTIMKLHGKTPTAYMEELGLWDKDVWAAHSIWLTDSDIDILKKHGVGVAHNPKCNMKIADGAAPIKKMLDKDVAVGLGIDSCAVSDNTDFFEAMRVSVFLQRLHTMDPTAVLGSDALMMATIGGAKAIKKQNEIGSIEKGKQADLLLVDLKRYNTRPYNNLINNLVFAANSSNIHTVMVGGEVLVENGEITKFNEKDVLCEAEEYAKKIFTDGGLEISPYFVINE